MAGLPYLWNYVSGGTLHKIQGLQDASFAVKYRQFSVKFGKSKLSLFAMGNVSTLLSNYDVDFLPLTIGAHVKYKLPFFTHIEIRTDGSYIIEGRNFGQATSFGAGIYYFFTISKKTTTPATHP